MIHDIGKEAAHIPALKINLIVIKECKMYLFLSLIIDNHFTLSSINELHASWRIGICLILCKYLSTSNRENNAALNMVFESDAFHSGVFS